MGTDPQPGAVPRLGHRETTDLGAVLAPSEGDRATAVTHAPSVAQPPTASCPRFAARRPRIVSGPTMDRVSCPRAYPRSRRPPVRRCVRCIVILERPGRACRRRPPPLRPLAPPPPPSPPVRRPPHPGPLSPPPRPPLRPPPWGGGVPGPGRAGPEPLDAE